MNVPTSFLGSRSFIETFRKVMRQKGPLDETPWSYNFHFFVIDPFVNSPMYRTSLS